MTTMTRPAPDLTRHQLGLAVSRTDPNGHGLAVLTRTDDGEVLAVCVCAKVGYGDTPEAARADLTAAHAQVTP